MDPDDHVCLCFHVSLRKLTTFMNRECPRVPSQLSDCLGAGTGCHWCVPFLEEIYRTWEAGGQPDLPASPEEYASCRKHFRVTGERQESPPPASD